MEGLSGVFKVWDNGLATALDIRRADLVEFHNEIRNRTGAKFGIATRWVFKGEIYEDAKCPLPIPDFSGLVYATEGWKNWVILNPDGSVRGKIGVPKISAQSKPEKGDLGEPRYMKGDPLNIMYGEGSDGDRDDCRFFFNMHTGELVRVELVGRHW